MKKSLILLILAICCSCEKVPAPAATAERGVAALSSTTCQILPGPAAVGLGFQDSQLCKADGTTSVLFYGDTVPALFYPDADQHAFFNRAMAPFPVMGGKLYVPVLHASGANWYTMPCFAQYHTCRDAHPPPWPDNTCEQAHDWQVFNPNTLQWLAQADVPGGPDVPVPQFTGYVCPTPAPAKSPTATRTAAGAPTKTPTPLSKPSSTPVGGQTPGPTCPPCPPTPIPTPCPCQTPPPGGPSPSPSAVPSPAPTQPCFPPFCVSPGAAAARAGA